MLDRSTHLPAAISAGWRGLAALALMVVIAEASIPARSDAAGRVDNSTLAGKMIAGYQGWFGCPEDGSGRDWVHWKSAGQWTVDMLPDVTELTGAERCNTGLTAQDGTPVAVFSSQNRQTVDRHFVWMEQYGLDGVALQRFAAELLHPALKLAEDRVLDNVRQGAEKHGRVFFLMYDLSGLPPDRLDVVFDDWQRLSGEGLTRSPSYLRHRGRPVLGLWGLGFAGRPLSPAALGALLDRLNGSGGSAGVAVVGGVPADWRTNPAIDPGWKAIWPRLDVISPWTVGAYADASGADRYRTRVLVPDLEEARTMGVDLMPVAFPGFSWANLMHARHEDAKAIRNQIPRRCGTFYWRQIANALSAGAPMLYTAMFDEVDEGTAIFKVTAPNAATPAMPSFVGLDEDGCSASSDLYLRLAGHATRILAGQEKLDPSAPLPNGSP